MGGKGQATPPPVQPIQPRGGGMDDMTTMLMMMEMMSAKPEAEAPQYIPPPPPLPEMPEIQKPAKRNWAEEYDKLRAMARADYQAANKDHHGRVDTIHTSPLLDEETPNYNSKVPLVA